jgi:predicted phage tail protein
MKGSSDMGMSVGASMGMQLTGKGQNSKAASIICEYDRLNQQKNQLEKSKNLSKAEKEKKLKLIEEQMNDLQQQISVEQQKDNSKQQVENQQKEQKKLEDTLPPKVADMVMQMHQMMKTALNVDSAQSNPQDAQDASEKMQADTTAAQTTKDATATGSADATNTAQNQIRTDAASDAKPGAVRDVAGNLIVTAQHATATPKDELHKTTKEQLTDLIEQIREENDKSSELEKIPEGLLVDEYR